MVHTFPHVFLRAGYVSRLCFKKGRDLIYFSYLVNTYKVYKANNAYSYSYKAIMSTCSYLFFKRCFFIENSIMSSHFILSRKCNKSQQSHKKKIKQASGDVSCVLQRCKKCSKTIQEKKVKFVKSLEILALKVILATLFTNVTNASLCLFPVPLSCKHCSSASETVSPPEWPH